jgi:hypothetical protein
MIWDDKMDSIGCEATRTGSSSFPVNGFGTGSLEFSVSPIKESSQSTTLESFLVKQLPNYKFLAQINSYSE